MDSEITIVLYHHISSDADRLTHQLDLSTTPEVFEQHVRYFAKNFDFVRPADLFSGVLPRKALLITFDDAYKSVLDVGGPILSGVNAPSLFFLNPATIMKDTLPIDNALSFAVEELGLPKVLSLMNVKNSGLTSTSELISSILPEMKLAEVKAAKQRILSETQHDHRIGATCVREYSALRELCRYRRWCMQIQLIFGLPRSVCLRTFAFEPSIDWIGGARGTRFANARD